MTRYSQPLEAQRWLDDHIPDLLVTSDRMPGLSGETIVSELLSRDEKCAVIVTSAWEPSREWVRKLCKAGERIAYLPVPCALEDFRDALRAIGFDARLGEDISQWDRPQRLPRL